LEFILVLKLENNKKSQQTNPTATDVAANDYTPNFEPIKEQKLLKRSTKENK